MNGPVNTVATVDLVQEVVDLPTVSVLVGSSQTATDNNCSDNADGRGDM
jgi:hypothetical protein